MMIQYHTEHKSACLVRRYAHQPEIKKYYVSVHPVVTLTHHLSFLNMSLSPAILSDDLSKVARILWIQTSSIGHAGNLCNRPIFNGEVITAENCNNRVIFPFYMIFVFAKSTIRRFKGLALLIAVKLEIKIVITKIGKTLLLPHQDLSSHKK